MIQTIYAGFRFLFELLCVGVWSYWGFTRTEWGGWRLILGIVAPLALLLIWGTWGAPMSQNRLAGLALFALELGLYAVSAFLMYHTKLQKAVVPFMVVAVLNAAFHLWIDHV